ncbi:MAG: hypothetical protein BGO43_00805 [Gammaproteobacteria bacterium 39-13]|nr:MAG: hypothetical protein BGO43_00805 [Gammaproteobacteria bacterium 39-13]
MGKRNNSLRDKSAFVQSLQIAINRSATQIASIIITAMLGLESTEILAEFSISLSFAAILFVLVTTIQMGIQAEFGRRFAQKNFTSLASIFSSVTIVVFMLSCILAGAIWLLPNPFSNTASYELAENAYSALKILAFSLPLVGLLTTITFFLESIEKIKEVARLRIAQIFIQIGLIFIVIVGKNLGFVNYELTSKNIALAYVFSDVVMLLTGAYLLLINIKKEKLQCFVIDKRILIALNSLLDVIKLGFPVMFGMIGQRFIFYLYLNFAAKLGAVQASAFAIINSYIFFCQIPLLGLAHLMTIKISQARGEKNSSKLSDISFKYSKLYFIEIIIIGSLFFVLQPYLLQTFTKDEQVLQSLSALQWIACLYFLMNVALTYSMSALRGYSDTLIPQIILISLLSLGISVCYFLFSDLWNMLMVFSLSGFAAAYFLLARMFKIKRADFICSETTESNSSKVF